jgi:exopolyphosphatase/pppGpp-phosphohydrolase
MGVLKRLAVIEVGTKGIRLLVVRRRESPPGMDILESRGELGNLGEALARNQGRMHPDNIRASALHVHRFFRLARRRDADRVVLVGTEVFRRAANVDDFRESLPASLTLRILAPEEEAVGAFLAARWGLRRDLSTHGQLVVIDLGGGSLEVIGGRPGNPPRPRACVSLPAVGTLALRESWNNAATRLERERDVARYIDSEIGRHRAHFEALRVSGRSTSGAPTERIVAGLGSTVTDSAWLLSGRLLSRYRSRDVNGLRTERGELVRLRAHLSEVTGRAADSASPRLPGIRDPLGLQLGLATLLPVMQALDAPALTACGTGLRFGLAYAFLHGIPLKLARTEPRGV